MWKKILLAVGLVLVLVVGGFAAVVAMQPNDFAVERSTTIDAPPAAIFAQLNDFQKWNDWSPWVELDPNAKATMSNPSSGEGAEFTWEGNDQVGAGKMTIVKSQPHERIEVKQSLTRPMEGDAVFHFILTPSDGGTKLVWRMEGKNNFMGKAVCMVMDLDKCVGENFEKALANIKTVAEKQAAAPPLVPEGAAEDVEAS